MIRKNIRILFVFMSGATSKLDLQTYVNTITQIFLPFLSQQRKINFHLQFVGTQSIAYRSRPLSGDEGTITEYGSVRVTEWPLVDVFVLHPNCCVEY